MAASPEVHCCPRSDDAPPSGVGTVPIVPLPEKRLLPNVPDVPEIAVLLNAMSLFDSRTDEPLCTPMLLWLASVYKRRTLWLA